MLKNQNPKIDSFYVFLIVTAIALAAIVIVTFKGIFTAVITAYETDNQDGADIRVDKEALDKAGGRVFDAPYTKLKLEN